MPLKIVLTADAEQDLEAAISHLLERSPQAAAVLIEKVLNVAQRLADLMFDGPWQVLSDGRRVQSWPIPPYRLFYQRSEYALIVLRIYHQSRRPL